MEFNEITFDNLPKAVAHLIKEISEIKSILEKLQQSEKPTKRLLIDIDEASRIISKAKPTIYALVRNRTIPHYKNGKKLYFYEDELLAWVESGKRKTFTEINNEAKAGYLQLKNRKLK